MASNKAEAIVHNAVSFFVTDSEGRICLLNNLRVRVGEPDGTGLWCPAQAQAARRLLTQNLRFFGPKCASDFLLGLGLSDYLLALDVRLLNLRVDHLGWDPAWRQRVSRLLGYEMLDEEVVRVMCEPLALRPLEVDRLLFPWYEEFRAPWQRLVHRA